VRRRDIQRIGPDVSITTFNGTIGVSEAADCPGFQGLAAIFDEFRVVSIKSMVQPVYHKAEMLPGDTENGFGWIHPCVEVVSSIDRGSSEEHVNDIDSALTAASANYQLFSPCQHSVHRREVKQLASMLNKSWINTQSPNTRGYDMCLRYTLRTMLPDNLGTGSVNETPEVVFYTEFLVEFRGQRQYAVGIPPDLVIDPDGDDPALPLPGFDEIQGGDAVTTSTSTTYTSDDVAYKLAPTAP
jgi:hypothetical protein